MSLLATLALTGCVRNYGGHSWIGGVGLDKFVRVAYEGDFKPFEEVAVVTNDGFLYVQEIRNIQEIEKPLKFREFDNQHSLTKWANSYQRGFYQYHLLPGTYIFEMGYFFYNGAVTSSSTSSIKRIFTVKAGEVVHLSATSPTRYTWNVRMSETPLAELPRIKEDFYKLTTEKK